MALHDCSVRQGYSPAMQRLVSQRDCVRVEDNIATAAQSHIGEHLQDMKCVRGGRMPERFPSSRQEDAARYSNATFRQTDLSENKKSLFIWRIKIKTFKRALSERKEKRWRLSAQHKKDPPPPPPPPSFLHPPPPLPLSRLSASVEFRS
ncbi:hypothetical protein ABVT39_020544 [Epinephelus coioides]